MLTTQPSRWGYNLQFQGVYGARLVNNVTNITNWGIQYLTGRIKLSSVAFEQRIVRRQGPRSFAMKLPLIAASVVAYTMLAVAWIVYAGLTPPNPLF